MNILKYGILFFLGILTFPLFAQVGVTGRIKTEIVAPLIVVETEQMGFGKFTSDMGGGTIQLSPQGERTATGSIRLVEGAFGAGKFLITGSLGTLVTLTLPQSPVELRLENGSYTLTVDHFTSDVPIGGKTISKSNGRTEMNVGATLYVGNWSSSPAGFYTGTYEAVFMYN
ncbi:DUF4402 domain-containing protein [uncultured Bacteroides sp.]|uniref:DUF4402 domain-containing protein n=1 Tax=uncultured Bacteroides sp. TaxID=162156 RepID=UPI002AAC1DAC|nr:DUF4402 domain-containing protein [uncultured Bacteroides sp.]